MSKLKKYLACLDARMIQHSGIGTHVRGLLEGFQKLGTERQVLLLGNKELLKSTPQSEPFDAIEFDAPIYSLGEQFKFPARRIYKAGTAVFHSPHYNFPVRSGRLKRIVTVHDIIHLTHAPDLHPAKKVYAQWMLQRVVNKVDLLLSVSHHSASELEREFGYPASDITITYNAPADIFRTRPDDTQIAAICEEMNLESKGYYITVGIDKPHKNYSLALRSLAQLWADQQSSSPLVMVGIPPDRKSAYLASLPAEHREVAEKFLRLPGKVAWEKLPPLLAGARALLFPSLAEGFGLPIVEAQGVGTPVIASNAASIPEVGGESVLLFDPESEEECRDAILKLESDDTLREELAAKGRENIERFTWEKTAEKVLKSYQSLQP